MNKTDLMFCTDGYKLDHRRQYPPGTEFVYANFTPRSTRIVGQDRVPWVGLRPFIGSFFGELACETFFNRSVEDVVDQYKRFLDSYLGQGHTITTEHIRELHRYGEIPLEICALPEGMLVPFRVPCLTVENTHKDFFWVTNYFETPMSAGLWGPCTSAATARRYRSILETYCALTAPEMMGFVDWQAHDFSYRGMFGTEASSLSGLGHLAIFRGTDNIPAIRAVAYSYALDDDNMSIIGSGVPATEHSVVCAGGRDNEEETINRLLTLYPDGVVSYVSDTWNLWDVLTHVLPALRNRMMSRDGKFVVRPDSGDPVLILTGDASAKPGSPQHKGVVECLWDLFGGSYTKAGYRLLDSHIGTIYGDAISEERCLQICQRLEAKKFASTNAVFGLGSYSYQYTTRDVNGFAVKSTWAQIDGKEVNLFKDPVTDNGTKRSATGRLAVIMNKGKLELIEGLTKQDQRDFGKHNFLQRVWREGAFVQDPPNWRFVRSLARDEVRYE